MEVRARLISSQFLPARRCSASAPTTSTNRLVANLDRGNSQQPWCAYALHLATLSPPAAIGDGLLVFLLCQATQNWDAQSRHYALGTLLLWMFISKFVKLLGHFVRYPADVVLLPVSILFGYFHGLIKVYAFFSLNVVWISKAHPDYLYSN